MALVTAAGATLADIGLSAMNFPNMLRASLESMDLLDARPDSGTGMLKTLFHDLDVCNVKFTLLLD